MSRGRAFPREYQDPFVRPRVGWGLGSFCLLQAPRYRYKVGPVGRKAMTSDTVGHRR
jgi:hypothetical protein